jgi:hypothetical protein
MNVKNMIIAVVFLLSAGAVSAQDLPTPTLEQCRANYAMWHGADLKTFVYSVLLHRGQIMSACAVVAASQHGNAKTREDFEESVGFSDLAYSYCLEIGARYTNYLARHNEVDRFIKEEAAGQR